MYDLPPLNPIPVPSPTPCLTLDEFRDIDKRIRVQQLHLYGVESDHLMIFGITGEEFAKVKATAEFCVERFKKPE